MSQWSKNGKLLLHYSQKDAEIDAASLKSFCYQDENAKTQQIVSEVSWHLTDTIRWTFRSCHVEHLEVVCEDLKPLLGDSVHDCVHRWLKEESTVEEKTYLRTLEDSLPCDACGEL